MNQRDGKKQGRSNLDLNVNVAASQKWMNRRQEAVNVPSLEEDFDNSRYFMETFNA